MTDRIHTHTSLYRIHLLWKTILATLLLMASAGSAKGDDTDFCVETITTSNGLSNNTVRDIMQDSQGYIWICTPNGLNRYDGMAVQQFGKTGLEGQRLTDNRTRRLSEDEQGHIWVSGMSDVFSCYDMKRRCFLDLTSGGKYILKYRHCKHIGKETWLYGGSAGGAIVTFAGADVKVTPLGDKQSQLASHIVNFVKEVNGQIWIGTEKGLYRCVGSTITCVENKGQYVAHLSDEDRELFMTSQGSILILSAKGKSKEAYSPKSPLINIYGVAKWHNLCVIYTEEGCTAFDMANARYCEVPQELRMTSTRRLIQDNKGGTWVSDKDNNLLYIGKKNIAKRFNLIPKDVLMQTPEFFAVCHGANDILWISTTGCGLFTYNIKTDELVHYSSENSSERQIPSNYLKYVTQDRSGSVWLGTALSGILHLQFTSPQRSHYLKIARENDSFRNQIRFIKKMDDGNVLLSNRNGELYTMDFPTSDNQELPAADRQAKVSENQLKLINSYNNIVYCAEYDVNGRLWVGTKGGGLYVGNDHYTYSSALEISLSSDNVTDIVRDDNGGMWISTFGGGLNYAIADQHGGLRFRRFFDRTEDREIRMICKDHNGWMWLATSNGIIVFEPEHLLADPTRFVRLQESNSSLRTNEIRTIFCDQGGRIWISETGKGAACCTPTGNYLSIELEHFSNMEGIVMPMIQSFEEDAKGNIWISTESGMLCLDPKERKAKRHYFSYEMPRYSFCENSSANLDGRYLLFGSNDGILLIDSEEPLPESTFSDILISSIKLNGVEYTKPDIQLPHNFNSLELNFSNFTYSSPMPSPYVFLLEGVDTCWSEPVNYGRYMLNRLPSGHYRLHVRTFVDGSGWSDELILPIHVQKPFWAEWWFVALYVVSLILFLWFIRNQNIRHKGLKENYKNMEKKMGEVKKLFVEEIISNPSEAPNSDKQFITTLEAIVKEEMGNPNFTSEDMASRMNMSHTTFYNTTHRLLGKSPKEYIRHYRMKEAARLLVTSSNNVSQIAFMVGYNDVSYFSKIFKKHFDMSPLRYKAENAKN